MVGQNVFKFSVALFLPFWSLIRLFELLSLVGSKLVVSATDLLSESWTIEKMVHTDWSPFWGIKVLPLWKDESSWAGDECLAYEVVFLRTEDGI